MKKAKNPFWEQLNLHLKEELKCRTIKQLFNDNKRIDSLTIETEQLFVDFSKQRLTSTTLELLIDLAKSMELKKSIASIFNGDRVNTSENRAALHTALRLDSEEILLVKGENINLQVQQELDKMHRLVEKIQQGQWRGFSGKPITDVVNLGVGGSDLGPLLVCEALDEFKVSNQHNVNVHFASTMDGSQVSNLFNSLNPETTLFIIVSKSFGTVDTMSNAASAKAWLLNQCNCEKIIAQQHFVGISANQKKMDEWGIDSENQLKLWDWVGGRYSLWSTVGMTIAIKIGMANFRKLLAGAHAMDNHFKTTDFDKNIPVLLGLVGIWNTNFLNINAQAILPYDARLKHFPNYLTQLEMESNGKSVTKEGRKIDYQTCPILWGEVGPNAQHAFYQLLHQGTRRVACDFIAPIRRTISIGSNEQKALEEQHALTLANCLAQSRALMVGSDEESSDIECNTSSDSLSKQKYYPGNQPSTTILLDELSPFNLGQLIALYEHKVFVMATIWGINPFDQWGVELGKTMAKETLFSLKTGLDTEKYDSSTKGLIERLRGNC